MVERVRVRARARARVRVREFELNSGGKEHDRKEIKR